jgi:predicted ribosome quality control (RQC) complex YloA/Tae2 family protein
VAEPRAGVLALLAPARGGERIVWIGAAVGELRAGSDWPPSREVALPTPAQVPATSAKPDAKPDAAAEADLASGLAERAHAQAERASLEALRRALAKRLRARADKLDRTLRAVENDLARARAAEEERQKARLLLPEQGRVPRGAREVRVPDWSRLDEAGRPAEVALALDPALSAAQNAARWLKRAQRYAAALPRIEARLAEVRGSLAQARELLQRAEAAPDAAALRELELREPTREPPRERGPTRDGRAPAPRRLPFRCFRAQGGARILVGRSARDNDALTFKAARGNDLWLHARGVQGSHVIVPDPGPSPAGDLLLEAALLAGHFSSARGADQVEVAWTRRKHVRKQKGAPPGAVVYAQEKTLRVRLGGEGLAALLAREEK